MAQNTSTIWLLRHVAPTCLALPLRSPRPNAYSRAMDTSYLRRAALCPPPIFQADRFRARTGTHGYARCLGNRAKHRVSVCRGRHIPGLVLRDAERAPRFVGSTCGRGPCVATRRRYIAADALDWRFGHRLVVVCRGEAPAGRIGDVCTSEGTRECMGCPSRTRTRFAHREMWESSGKFIRLVSVTANGATLSCMMCISWLHLRWGWLWCVNRLSPAFLCCLILCKYRAPTRFVWPFRHPDRLFTNMLLVVQNDPQHLSGLVRRVLYQFIGPN